GRGSRRAAAGRLLLWADRADLGRAVCCRGALCNTRSRDRRRGAHRATANGVQPMNLRRLMDLLPPLAFGLAVLAIWEAGVRLLNVPAIILPPRSATAARFATSVPTLAADFRQTIQGVLAGYVIGSPSGFVVAILIDRS